MSELYPCVLGEQDWYYAQRIGQNTPPVMVISEDVGGLTLVAYWIRTDALVRINNEEGDGA